MNAKLEAKALSKTYVSGRSGERVEALRDISFRVLPHEFVSIVGPSGCGKSTLLSLAAGFVMPSSGEVLADGTPIVGPDPRRGVMFQDYALFPWRTVLGNVEFGPLARGASPASRQATARRYIEHVARGWSIHLFVQPRKETPFAYLGTVRWTTLGNAKRAVLPDQSKNLGPPSVPGLWWKLPSRLNDEDVAVSRVALTGPDVWIDKMLFKSLFLSGPLGDSLDRAGLRNSFQLHRCRVL